VKQTKQGDDASLNEVETPDLSGESSDIADGSISWDMTKTQEPVDQVLLEVYPSMTSDKARTLLEMAYGDFDGESDTGRIDAVNAAPTTAFGGGTMHAKAQPSRWG
jgi:hypothetical protein